MKRPLAWPLVPAYGLAVVLKSAAYDHHLFRVQNLTRPVISVGNLSTGGTGKTPCVILLARLLAERGWNVDVLSRGYGRRSQAVARVNPQGTVEQYGDEPLLMARRGLDVYVGANRYLAGILAEKFSEEGPGSAPAIHLLDDGFQHRKLARTINIVLVQNRDLNDHLLPAGDLREPLRALQRADICILQADDSGLQDRVLRGMGETDPSRIWIMERKTILPCVTGKGLAFCAIGDPAGFFNALQAEGVDLMGKIAFADHHAFTRKNIEQIVERAQKLGTVFFVTTEKDNIRLPDSLRAQLERQCPLIIARLETSLANENNAIATLTRLLRDSAST